MLGEELAFEVGDGDLVAVDDDQDVLEAMWSADPVVDPGQHEGAGTVSFLTVVPAGRSSGAGAGRRSLVAAWMKKGCSGVGRGASAFGVASHAVRGVTRPGSPWWGRSVL